ncbi:ATP synthase F1 subunit gamma [Candidatus Cerribacteria bacterium 'Amazon FNV 2010 28 9']|uniref:ATP synthase gamma chain n=1 Tax=Candidatus Cerribacteria bacterium 'Amazon FNV 2010 28 9' TaxID=2081795 RepID=A0A317JPZ6_9BACT|nr:MAG: ATP synthase F1 subunit gamma [Candidatus Cerribacteria bacterium 'Amazon FNV 2010 28 9']
MAQTRLIKSRIKSATNIAKITKAMEMVSASKMRKAQSQALASRPYTHKLMEMLHTLAGSTDPSLHPLLRVGNPDAPVCIVLISTDRGLAGSLNANLFRSTFQAVSEYPNVVFITVGKKAKEFALKTGKRIIGEFIGLPDSLTLADVLPISHLIQETFLKDECSMVKTVHMQFVSTLTQKPEVTQLLPIAATVIPSEVEGSVKKEYVFEPSPQEMLGFLLPFYAENGFYQTMLEAKASEHSARMVAMKNASDNAKDIVSSLKLEYNKSRQASITTELLDITTASMTV